MYVDEVSQCRKGKRSARQKRPGDLRVLWPKASARELHQRNAGFFVFSIQKDKPSHARSGTWEGYEADFFGANSVASALGIRSGATPGGPRYQQPTTGADSNGRRPARCNPVGRLL